MSLRLLAEGWSKDFVQGSAHFFFKFNKHVLVLRRVAETTTSACHSEPFGPAQDKLREESSV
jgi:hypothetical protein